MGLLAVNVMNGNLVYREQDIEVEGPAVDLEVERYYNSLLPESENTEWGDGWTLAQTPKLEAEQTEGSAPPAKATMLRTSGIVQSSVALPTEPQGERFDAELHAVVTKEAGGGYEVADRSGETANALAFDQSGKVAELRTEGYAKVDYSYEADKLAEIAVDDPGSAGGGPPEEESGPEEIDDTPTFASAFGSNGSGDGQLKSPGDVALDAAGSIWVADKGNNRIQKFNPKGEFVSKFGSSGTGDGQLSIPTALAIDAQGNVWVTERGNNRVQKFSPSGEHLAKFGSYGTGNGQFSGPEGIAIDPKGNIWISDTYNGRVQKFNSSGEFLKVVGSYGSAPGQIGEATGIDSGPNGTVWVADWENNRVSAFDEGGEFLFHFGVAGTGNGQFNRPDAIDVDAKGNVWVGDQNNGRVQRFTEAGVYVDQFGSNGSGEGQFSFTYPMGIATNDKGGIWVTDVNNHRVQKWVIPSSVSNYTGVIYADSFGSEGSAPGQLKTPADVAVDSAGNLWVIDRGNDRMQKFSPKGEYLDGFGSSGTGNGQFVWPSGIAIDPEGNLFVTDSANHRVQKFNAQGEFLSKFGSYGTGNGQFNGPAGIAVYPNGWIGVTDRGNHRVQAFTKAGGYIGQVGGHGWEDAQFDEPTALAVGGPWGEFGFTVFVVDGGNNRIKRYTPLGGFIAKFGTYGTGDGQLDSPANIEVDAKGNVWVGDRRNARVQLFDQEGKYIDQFGSKGAEEGQFDLAYPLGIASDGAGGIWVTDGNHDRLQKWVAGSYVPNEEELPVDDPSVQVGLSSGLVSTVKGAEAGEHAYPHSGALLSAHEGPQGKASYAYDSAGRMTKVTLPNGTWGSITYNATYGRVSSVTVDPAGSDPAKTTYFEFSDEPRRTTVIPPDSPHVTYDIGADGSVLKWWNTQQPPQLDDLSGSLYFNRETSAAVSIGTHNLVAQAHSEEGIASIHFIANGSQLIDEMKCEQDPEKAGLECLTVVNEWVTETGVLTPGILQLEVITTDRLGQTESERFWVNIPYTPPEPPGAVTPPKFMDILRFREEYGLEVIFPVANELELNDRIFDLIGAWYNPHTPAGEVARASWERWGVPLRPEDVAEMEYREWLYDVNAGRIDQWVEATQPSSYAGYYIDHPAGGIMHVGFLDNQAERLEGLKASLPLVAGERLQVYPTTPSVSYLAVQATSQSVSNAIESNATLRELVVSVSDGEAGKVVRVGTPDVAQVESILDQMLGPNAPITVEYDAGGGSLLSGRFRNQGRMRAGDFVVRRHYSYPNGLPVHDGNEGCTAGFGAKDKAGEVRGDTVWRLFVLTAGHCTGFEVYAKQVFRSTDADPLNEEHWREVGSVARDAYNGVLKKARTDAEAIRVYGSDIVPQGIYGWNGNLIPTGQAGKARVGNVLCFSGARTQVPQCGRVVARSTRWKGPDGIARGGYWVKFRTPAIQGDSGAPVWSPAEGGRSIGLVTAGRPEGSLTETLVEPLLHPYHMASNVVPGILHDPSLRPLSLKHR